MDRPYSEPNWIVANVSYEFWILVDCLLTIHDFPKISVTKFINWLYISGEILITSIGKLDNLITDMIEKKEKDRHPYLVYLIYNPLLVTCFIFSIESV